MKKTYYITKDGELIRKENTIYFQNEFIKRALPVEQIDTIYAYGSLTISSGAVLYLGKMGIPVHFFDRYGWYKSTLYPRETLVSGDLLIKQAKAYLDADERMFLAKRFVEGASRNILKNLTYYQKQGFAIKTNINKIERLIEEIENQEKITNLMNVEGRIREAYFDAVDKILPEPYKMAKRERRPPTNRMNAMVSFGNSLVYTTTLSEIYHTQLNPTISFLHEPFVRRFSLSLDVAEIFKPILTDRIIFKLVRKNMLDDGCFEGEMGDMLLSEKGRKIFLKEYENRLSTTIKHKSLDKNISYRRLIRLELYKICKHLLSEREYKPLIMWW